MNNWISIISATLASGVVVTVINYFKDRRKLNNDSELAERIRESQVAVADISAIQAKQAALEVIITQQANHITRLTAAGIEADERDTRRLARIRELEIEVDTIRQKSRETEDLCNQLSIKLRHFTRDVINPDS